MRDELRDGDELQIVLGCELLELRAARGRAVIVAQDLADDARGREPSEAREIDRRLRVPDALQHAARTRAQRLHVAAEANVVRAARRIGSDADGRRAILRADAGRDAVARRRVDALRVRRAQCVEVRSRR